MGLENNSNGFHTSEGQDYTRHRYIARLAYNKIKKQTIDELRRQRAQTIEYLKTQRESNFPEVRSSFQFLQYFSVGSYKINSNSVIANRTCLELA